MKPTSVIILLAAIIINAHTLHANSNDTLPSADNRDHVSPVSIRGIIDTVSDSIITIQFENKTNKIKKHKIRVITKTKIFTEYGGVVNIDELAVDQYIWIWYPIKKTNLNKILDEQLL